MDIDHIIDTLKTKDLTKQKENIKSLILFLIEKQKEFEVNTEIDDNLELKLYLQQFFCDEISKFLINICDKLKKDDSIELFQGVLLTFSIFLQNVEFPFFAYQTLMNNKFKSSKNIKDQRLMMIKCLFHNCYNKFSKQNCSELLNEIFEIFFNFEDLQMILNEVLSNFLLNDLPEQAREFLKSSPFVMSLNELYLHALIGNTETESIIELFLANPSDFTRVILNDLVSDSIHPFYHLIFEALFDSDWLVKDHELFKRVVNDIYFILLASREDTSLTLCFMIEDLISMLIKHEENVELINVVLNSMIIKLFMGEMKNKQKNKKTKQINKKKIKQNKLEILKNIFDTFSKNPKMCFKAFSILLIEIKTHELDVLRATHHLDSMISTLFINYYEQTSLLLINNIISENSARVVVEIFLYYLQITNEPKPFLIDILKVFYIDYEIIKVKKSFKSIDENKELYRWLKINSTDSINFINVEIPFERLFYCVSKRNDDLIFFLSKVLAIFQNATEGIEINVKSSPFIVDQEDINIFATTSLALQNDASTIIQKKWAKLASILHISASSSKDIIPILDSFLAATDYIMGLDSSEDLIEQFNMMVVMLLVIENKALRCCFEEFFDEYIENFEFDNTLFVTLTEIITSPLLLMNEEDVGDVVDDDEIGDGDFDFSQFNDEDVVEVIQEEGDFEEEDEEEEEEIEIKEKQEIEMEEDMEEEDNDDEAQMAALEKAAAELILAKQRENADIKKQHQAELNSRCRMLSVCLTLFNKSPCNSLIPEITYKLLSQFPDFLAIKNKQAKSYINLLSIGLKKYFSFMLSNTNIEFYKPTSELIALLNTVLMKPPKLSEEYAYLNVAFFTLLTKSLFSQYPTDVINLYEIAVSTSLRKRTRLHPSILIEVTRDFPEISYAMAIATNKLEIPSFALVNVVNLLYNGFNKNLPQDKIIELANSSEWLFNVVLNGNSKHKPLIKATVGFIKVVYLSLDVLTEHQLELLNSCPKKIFKDYGLAQILKKKKID
eukprot:TRINITY_DN3449_c0_g1_i1.p1 TRINITY_DN3449_c0_g1~~TRINITY_DN3449_c0_g1_i1.p1  ORF type:complete len:1010 (-),score=336.91 TRINITY_DN3449_c0_g1_i1:7-3036(-)